MLYPDSIGLGWSRIERYFLKSGCTVMVLNGRGRFFELTPKVRRKLKFLRFLELSFVVEMMLAPFLVTYGIVVFFKDKITGHS